MPWTIPRTLRSLIGLVVSPRSPVILVEPAHVLLPAKVLSISSVAHEFPIFTIVSELTSDPSMYS